MTKILAAVLAIGIAAAGFEAFRFLASGPGAATDQVVFPVPTGASLHRIAADLEKEGVVRSAFNLRVLAKLIGQGQLKRGEYALNKGMTPREVLNTLSSGKSIQYPITFPEGANIYDMAALLDARGMFKGAEFLTMVRDRRVVQELLGVDVSSLEGYLFPETYNVTRFTPLRELVSNMVQNFKQNYAQLEADLKSRGRQPPLARHEIVTLASVVEKETGAPEERPLIASIFYNRLAKKMRLQSDPTIVYGIWVETGAYKQNITRDDITRPTRYNTYTVPRLPWGPISNPGRAALAATLSPATSENLYFVSRNDGTHVFTKTYDDHLNAVKTFQLDPAARQGRSWRDLNKRVPGAATGPSPASPEVVH